MATGINQKISTVEKKWLGLLFNQCRSYFQDVHLPSHDHHHHFRVWYFAREMINILSGSGVHFPEKLIESIIISVFFHDAGMSVTRDEHHGKGAYIVRVHFAEQLACGAGVFQRFFSAGDAQENGH